MVAIAHPVSEAKARAAARWQLDEHEREEVGPRQRHPRPLEPQSREEWQRARRAARRAAIVRRRRIAVVLLIIGLLSIGVVLGRLSRVAHAGAPTSTPGQPVPIARTAYVVQPGDTLWRIARTLQPQGDVRPLVDRLSHSLHGAPLRPGARILLPDGMTTGG